VLGESEEMDASDLTSEQRETLLQLGKGSDHETFSLEIYNQLKQLGIVCARSDGTEHLSELGESICKQLADLTDSEPVKEQGSV
jgi:hypothetical protein